ncbi:Dormancy-associated protein-like protein [Vigna angularis]|uniref:Dormancy-associated protein-like protein n=1 Tax=Phaseolus angularis TaxID=3914 RepID=A0A8T0JS65_PHAAN|nr:dormancy-associated protein homolog 4 isoform X1 [Vigna angularis]KAG2380066.1 Dormancy-associated protein-like protein [Vigna angularis]
MGFLHKLWDETLAGPTPETGLGKLRKFNNSSAGGPAVAEDVPISRSITIIRTHSGLGSTSTSAPASPSSVPDTPCTPFSPEAPGGGVKKFTRRKSSTVEGAENRSPTIYDWVIMSALDRY